MTNITTRVFAEQVRVERLGCRKVVRGDDHPKPRQLSEAVKRPAPQRAAGGVVDDQRLRRLAKAVERVSANVQRRPLDLQVGSAEASKPPRLQRLPTALRPGDYECLLMLHYVLQSVGTNALQPASFRE